MLSARFWAHCPALVSEVGQNAKVHQLGLRLPHLMKHLSQRVLGRTLRTPGQSSPNMTFVPEKGFLEGAPKNRGYTPFKGTTQPRVLPKGV